MIPMGRMSGIAVLACALAAISTAAGPRDALPVAHAPTEGGAMPDVWVCYLPSTAYWGQADGIHAFSIATTSANAGNVNLNWVDTNNQHPVIAQNMYRLKEGVLEQVGMSWLKHGFCAVQQNIGCGACVVSGGCLSFLKPGCSDPYDAALNATTFRLGPRSEVNPTTGVFPFPHAVGDPGVPAVIRSRLQVRDEYVNPAQNEGARWFVEGQYVHPQDAQANVDNNNASHREFNIGGFSFTPNSSVSPIGTTIGMKAMIEGWADIDPTVQVEHIEVSGEGGGRLIVASRASDNGDGTWHYEYAVYNMNADRAAGSFSVPVGDGANLSNVGFHDAEYHSGELYDGADWAATEGDSAVTWSTTSFDIDPMANALRWSTMYNFRFDANAAPVTTNATIGLFKTGSPVGVTAAVQAPGEAPCAADFNGDGIVDGADLATLLALWGMGGAADLDSSGAVDGADLAQLLANWGSC